VLLSHALDRLEKLFELLLAHEITANLPSKFIQKVRPPQVVGVQKASSVAQSAREGDGPDRSMADFEIGDSDSNEQAR
jgi:hypothetical protein